MNDAIKLHSAARLPESTPTPSLPVFNSMTIAVDAVLFCLQIESTIV